MATTFSRPGAVQRLWPVATLFARVALAAAFLSAVADRFGLWGVAGTGNVAWGGFDAFLAYLSTLAPYLPDGLMHVAGWAVTAVEVVLGITLLLGAALRWSAITSAALLVVFGVSMLVFSGFEAPLNASVFSAAAAALLLALAPDQGHVLSLDRLRTARSTGLDTVTAAYPSSIAGHNAPSGH